jgi:phenylalanyl-tRNA synthetase alpha chain
MADEILLNEAAYAVWQTVKERGPIELGEVVKLTGVDQAQVSAAATEAAKEKFFEIKEREREEIVFSEQAKELVSAGLPEQLAVRALSQSGGKMTMAKFAEWAKSANVAVNEVLKWGTARGWVSKEKDSSGVYIEISSGGEMALADDLRDLDVIALRQADASGCIYLDAVGDGRNTTTIHQRLHRLLGNRPELAKIKNRIERTLSLTSAGAAAFPLARKVIERNSLTPEDLESGAWREIKLRPYEVKLAAKDVYPAKIHPLRKIIEQTRRAFLEMGFAEVVSPMVESAFWNFDALFQPQDHPARDMQDTFYMLHPAEAPLPDAKIMEPVKQTHENGWQTGSEGWGYTWSPERSKQVVLRTHTTAATIRALAANPNPPGKFFCVGWTYRNETISFKHLPVFHQVDGIIIDEEANLASLMGTLQEFYSKMGFGRVKFKPAFYPYTEPSVDVVVYMEARGKWLEMGGAGIFRPEVTLPLGCKYPVLAWGLGIERLAMLRFGLSDIRELYRPSLDALEGVPLCR